MNMKSHQFSMQRNINGSEMASVTCQQNKKISQVMTSRHFIIFCLLQCKNTLFAIFVRIIVENFNHPTRFCVCVSVFFFFPPNFLQSCGIKSQAVPLFTQRMTNIFRLYHLFSVLDSIIAIQFKKDYNQNDSYIVSEVIVQLQMQPWSQQGLN